MLILHGRDDSVIAFWHGRKLYELANEPKQFFEAQGVDHNNMETAPGYWEALQSFARSLEVNRNGADLIR